MPRSERRDRRPARSSGRAVVRGCPVVGGGCYACGSRYLLPFWKFSFVRWCLTFFALAVFSAGQCRAQSAAELERARGQFQQALSLEVAGDWAGALTKLDEVARVRLTPQVRFHIARCKEHLGRLTEALGDYRLAESQGARLEPSERKAISLAREQLEAKLPKLVVERPDSLVEATIELDGVELGASQIGREIAADPGEHRITVRNLAGKSFEKVVVLREGTTEQVDLTPPPGFFSSAASGTRAPVATTSPGAAPAATQTPRVWPYLAVGVGTVGLASAAALWSVRNDAKNELAEGCNGSVCPERLRDVQARGELASTLAPIALGVGAAALVSAIWAWWISPPGPDHRDRGVARVIGDVRPDYMGMHVSAEY